MNNHALLMLLLVCLPLVGCSTASASAPASAQTPDPAQVVVDANSSQATAISAAATAQYYSGQLTATVQAQHATATERAWLMLATQQAAEITSTARVWEATATADSMSATSAAAQASTAQSIQSTATQQVWNTTATANEASSQAYATAMAGEAISVELAVQRERMMNKVKAVDSLADPCFDVCCADYAGDTLEQGQTCSAGCAWDAPLLVIDGKVYDADRNPYPLLDVSNKKPEIPALVPPELQSPNTARDQMIDLATRGALDAPTSERRRLQRNKWLHRTSPFCLLSRCYSLTKQSPFSKMSCPASCVMPFKPTSSTQTKEVHHERASHRNESLEDLPRWSILHADQHPISLYFMPRLRNFTTCLRI